MPTTPAKKTAAAKPTPAPAAPKKLSVLDEVANTLENYQELEALAYAHSPQHAIAYRASGIRSAERVDNGDYSADTLILASLFEGLGEAKREKLIEAAAIIIAAVTAHDKESK